MSTSRAELIQSYKSDVLESLRPLMHSWEKLSSQKLPNFTEKNLDELEAWEALTSRFARVTDIFVSKYIRLLILEQDPGFRGEIRDVLDKAEKISLISSADTWMSIRELRNKVAHEYTKEDLQKTLQDIIKFTPFVLNELKELKLEIK